MHCQQTACIARSEDTQAIQYKYVTLKQRYSPNLKECGPFPQKFPFMTNDKHITYILHNDRNPNENSMHFQEILKTYCSYIAME